MRLSIYNPMKALREFHEKFGVRKYTEAEDQHRRELIKAVRCNLIREEADEVCEAIEAGDLEAVAKELADLLYVAYGTADVLDLPLPEVFNEVHRSNMSKLGVDGKPIYREDGKVLKGPNYRPADVAKVLGFY